MEKLSYSCRDYSEPLLNQRALTIPGSCNSQHDTNTVIQHFPYNHPQVPPSNIRERVMVWTQRGASCKCPCLVLAVLMLKLRTSCRHYRHLKFSMIPCSQTSSILGETIIHSVFSRSHPLWPHVNLYQTCPDDKDHLSENRALNMWIWITLVSLSKGSRLSYSTKWFRKRERAGEVNSAL